MTYNHVLDKDMFVSFRNLMYMIWTYWCYY